MHILQSILFIAGFWVEAFFCKKSEVGVVNCTGSAILIKRWLILFCNRLFINIDVKVTDCFKKNHKKPWVEMWKI